MEKAAKYFFMTRAVEHQERAADRLEDLKSEAISLKGEAAQAADEDAANRCLCIEKMADALRSQLLMWICLKQDRMDDAWDHLIDAQTQTRSSMQAHDMASHLQAYSERLHAIEELVFPPQVFLSVGGIIRGSRCSVCGEEYEECPHVKGRPYMGELCVREITDFEVREGSIVDTPANKHCRVIRLTDEEGVKRNWMTWREVEEP